MPTIESNGASIYYETYGEGFPILTFAPQGLKSVISVWQDASAPIDPTVEWSGEYQVIAMDQRNAGGRPSAPIAATDGWDVYTADHLAVLDARSEGELGEVEPFALQYEVGPTVVACDRRDHLVVDEIRAVLRMRLQCGVRSREDLKPIRGGLAGLSNRDLE